MAPNTRRNSVLARKIKSLQLTLAPLVPLPSGPPHPAFPRTLMAFHLLTEDELDSIAKYYHQSTPCQWTLQYPATMNWEKEYLAKPPCIEIPSTSAPGHASGTQDQNWLDDLMASLTQHQHLSPKQASRSYTELARPAAITTSSAGLSDQDRVRIKRRKVGKFIGLVGMETPMEEIAGRIQASFDRAVERSREECRRMEHATLGRQKVG